MNKLHKLINGGYIQLEEITGIIFREQIGGVSINIPPRVLIERVGKINIEVSFPGEELAAKKYMDELNEKVGSLKDGEKQHSL